MAESDALSSRFILSPRFPREAGCTKDGQIKLKEEASGRHSLKPFQPTAHRPRMVKDN